MKVFSFVGMIGLALTMASLREATWVQAQAGDDDRQTVSIPLGSTGLVFGEGLRTTLTNLGTRRISAQTRVIDADGALVKQESLLLEPGQMRTFEMSRAEVLRDERSVIVRTEVAARRAEARNLWMTSEVIDWSTGSTRFLVTGGGCPDYMCGTTGNHNETMVRDTAPMK
jgi:hypothetical protein